MIWIEPALSGPSGGSVYDEQVIAGLRRGGVTVHRMIVEGSWPHPDASTRRRVHEQLAVMQSQVGRVPVVVDGLVGGCLPELFTGEGAGPAADILLMHLPRSAESGSDVVAPAPDEGLAVRRAQGVVATSDWAAEDIRRLHGPRAVEVIAPGVAHPRPRRSVSATASVDDDAPPPRLTMAASFTPRKNHRLLAKALPELLDHRWTLQLAGPGADTATGAAVLEELQQRLPGRVHHLGVIPPEQMPTLWGRTDLLLLPSWAETFGMVVAEACAHGIPAVVSAGTGAQEALGDAGASCDPRRPDAWAALLRSWLEDPTLRRRWATTARARADKLPSWTQTAIAWQDLIRRLTR